MYPMVYLHESPITRLHRTTITYPPIRYNEGLLCVSEKKQFLKASFYNTTRDFDQTTDFADLRRQIGRLTSSSEMEGTLSRKN
jgi:hypothetical protein